MFWLLIVGSAFLLGAWLRQKASISTSPPGQILLFRAKQDPDSPINAGGEANRASSATPGRYAITELLFDLTSMSDPMGRRFAMLRFVNGLDESACRSAIAAVDGWPPSPERRELLGLLYEKWATTDHTTALESVQMRSMGEKVGLTKSVLRGWALTDAAAAVAWAQEDRSGPYIGGMIENFVAIVEALDEHGRWDDAARLISATPAMRDDVRVVPMLIEFGLVNGVAGVEEWISGLPEGERGEFFATAALATALAKRDPREAIAWVDELDNARRRRSMYSFVLREWLRTGNKIEAAEWVSSLPPDPKYDDLVGTLGAELAIWDSEIALRFIESVSSQRRRDLLLRERTEMLLTGGQAGAAAEWLSRVSDPEVRKRVGVDLYRKWSDQRPEVVRQFVDQLKEVAPEIWAGLPLDASSTAP